MPADQFQYLFEALSGSVGIGGAALAFLFYKNFFDKKNSKGNDCNFDTNMRDQVQMLARLHDKRDPDSIPGKLDKIATIGEDQVKILLRIETGQNG